MLPPPVSIYMRASSTMNVAVKPAHNKYGDEYKSKYGGESYNILEIVMQEYTTISGKVFIRVKKPESPKP